MIRVFLTDDHALVREGLRRIVNEEPHLEVVGEAEDGPSLMRQLATTEVDVLLLDLAMPGAAFPAILHQLREQFPSIRILVVSMFQEAEYGQRVLQGGAAGFVSKRRSVEELSKAIGRVFAGGTYLSGRSSPESAPVSLPVASPLSQLSLREFEILTLLARGQTVTAIGAGLKLSPKTVSTYRARVLRKLGLTSNADLVRFALEHQII